jgi:hypothetical protein
MDSIKIIKSLADFSPKRKLHTSRQSTLPSTLNTSNIYLRKLELENNNLELELAYSEYISSHAELILEKKIFQDTEIALTSSIKSLYEDTKCLQEKFKLIETRINDVKALSWLNDYVDDVQSRTKDFIGKLNILHKIHCKKFTLLFYSYLYFLYIFR